MQIKRMEAGDIPETVRLGQSCFAHPWTQEDYTKHYQEQDKIYLVCRHENMVVAGCAVWCSFETADLCNIMVREAYRGQGIAGRLLSRALALCRDGGVERLLLEVRESNVSAIRLYEKFHFQRIAVRMHYYREPPEDAVIMQCEV